MAAAAPLPLSAPAHYCPPSPPLSPHYDAAILDVGQPSPAPLYSLSVPLPPAAAMAMGMVDGVVICGGGLQGEVQGYGKMQDTRLLVLGSSKIFKGWKKEDGKQNRGEW